MIFASLVFLYLFLPANLIIYFLTKNSKARNLVLLGFSLFFYAWGEPLWVFVMMLTALADYLLGLLIEGYRGKWQAKLGLILSLTVPFGSTAEAHLPDGREGSLPAGEYRFRILLTEEHENGGTDA